PAGPQVHPCPAQQAFAPGKGPGKTVQDIVALLRSFGAARLAAMGAVAAGLVGFFVFLIVQMTAPQLTPLYTDLSFDDSSAILRELESRNVPYRVNADGST